MIASAWFLHGRTRVDPIARRRARSIPDGRQPTPWVTDDRTRPFANAAVRATPGPKPMAFNADSRWRRRPLAVRCSREPVQRGLVERDRRRLRLRQALARAQPGFDRRRGMLGRREVADPLLHRPIDRAAWWILRLCERAARVAGDQGSAPQIMAASVMQGGGHHRSERCAERSQVVERLARERKNVHIITAPGQGDGRAC